MTTLPKRTSWSSSEIRAQILPKGRILSQEKGGIYRGHQTLELSFQMMDRENLCAGSGSVTRLI